MYGAAPSQSQAQYFPYYNGFDPSMMGYAYHPGVQMQADYGQQYFDPAQYMMQYQYPVADMSGYGAQVHQLNAASTGVGAGGGGKQQQRVSGGGGGGGKQQRRAQLSARADLTTAVPRRSKGAAAGSNGSARRRGR